MTDMRKWESIVGTRVQGILDMIQAPTYLVVHKLDFMHAIWSALIKYVYKFHRSRIVVQSYVYSVLLPLERHFKGEEIQTFINGINSKDRMEAAIKRILDVRWEKDIREKGRIHQSIPQGAMKNYDGNSVGRGLRIAGTIQYWCQQCKKFVGFTPDDYWKHQESVHNNSEVIEWDHIVRKYKF